MAMRFAVIKIGTHSSAKLVLPENLTSDTIDTRQWKIDKTYIRPNFYYHYMIEALFQSNAVKLSRESRANLLSIGLGGGTLDGFLHSVFPKMNITVVEISPKMVDMARKWFGLKEDGNYRVEIADGITYLAKNAKNSTFSGFTYDAILLDACITEVARGIICPVETFLDDEVLKNIARSIRKEDESTSIKSTSIIHNILGKLL
ncbi:hypothetical protein Y032_0099g3148 [Ancylostoma ceylanicum]|uniref:Methyltransferase domain-containing protein n=1 Tax=Ancylostoma ceylanicum TaxID=53326 RepID=A0A016THR4_9BILA|nr:hypothetical protein Y032_0099g3148 [Ancylostoma ceylanicum]